MKRLLICLLILFTGLSETFAVLKERDLEQTLEILRTELTDISLYQKDMNSERKTKNLQILSQLIDIVKQSNQNALMLYSQK